MRSHQRLQRCRGLMASIAAEIYEPEMRFHGVGAA